MSSAPDHPPAGSVTRELLKRRHNLPHWQCGGSTYFVTFRSARGMLPAAALELVRSHILFDHDRRYELILGVIMPDHVHIVFRPLQTADSRWHDLSKILQGLKGSSARSINQLLGAEGPVWQKESFDRIIRNQDEYAETLNYMWENPWRAGLVAEPQAYGFFVFPPEKDPRMP